MSDPQAFDAEAKAVDAAYARLTKKALTQRQVWDVTLAVDRAGCTESLNNIIAGGGIVYDVLRAGATGFDIIWYRWDE